MERPSGIDATLHCRPVWSKCSVSSRSRVSRHAWSSLQTAARTEPVGLFPLVWAGAAIIMRDYFFSCFGAIDAVAGTILLLGGFLLCVSIVWAAVGLGMIGFGLVCLLIAERRKKQSIAVVVT